MLSNIFLALRGTQPGFRRAGRSRLRLGVDSCLCALSCGSFGRCRRWMVLYCCMLYSYDVRDGNMLNVKVLIWRLDGPYISVQRGIEQRTAAESAAAAPLRIT